MLSAVIVEGHLDFNLFLDWEGALVLRELCCWPKDHVVLS